MRGPLAELTEQGKHRSNGKPAVSTERPNRLESSLAAPAGDGSTVDVDLSKEAGAAVEGSFNESAEFKALVYSLTAQPGTTAVRVRIGGERVATLPGGHFELDEPLTRQSF